MNFDDIRGLMDDLSARCVESYTQDDIIEHYLEEILESGLALERVRRRREPVINFLEEVVDTFIDAYTVLKLIETIAGENPVDNMLKSKLDKFKLALDNLNTIEPGKQHSRYKGDIVNHKNFYAKGLNGFEL